MFLFPHSTPIPIPIPNQSLLLANTSVVNFPKEVLILVELLGPAKVKGEDRPVTEEENRQEASVVHAKPLVGTLGGRGNRGNQGSHCRASQASNHLGGGDEGGGELTSG